MDLLKIPKEINLETSYDNQENILDTENYKKYLEVINNKLSPSITGGYLFNNINTYFVLISICLIVLLYLILNYYNLKNEKYDTRLSKSTIHN